MNKIPEGWRKVKFGDVVNRVKDEESDRSKWTTDKYVGGQHFPEGEIRVTEYGSIEEDEWVIGSAFKVKFKPGDVLYVTRNPRLRKGGMVDFEGICSDVTYVLRADENQLLQSLLPFIIQTEDFVKHTCNNAHGSTNPFLNWKDIAKYEFYLPPLEEQKKISEVLWSVEENVKKLYNRTSNRELYKNKKIGQWITKGVDHNKYKDSKFGRIPKNWKVVRLSEIISEPLNNGINKDKQNFGFGTKFVNIIDNYCYDTIDVNKLGRMNVTKKEERNYSLKEGDITVVRSSVKPSGVGYPALFSGDKEPVVFCGFVIKIRPDKDKILPKYLLHFLRWKKTRKKVLEVAGVNAVTNINQNALNNINIILPDRIEEQKQICDLIEKMDNQIHVLNNYLSLLKSLRNKLLNELLLGKLKLEGEND